MHHFHLLTVRLEPKRLVVCWSGDMISAISARSMRSTLPGIFFPFSFSIDVISAELLAFLVRFERSIDSAEVRSAGMLPGKTAVGHPHRQCFTGENEKEGPGGKPGEGEEDEKRDGKVDEDSFIEV